MKDYVFEIIISFTDSRKLYLVKRMCFFFCHQKLKCEERDDEDSVNA